MSLGKVDAPRTRWHPHDRPVGLRRLVRGRRRRSVVVFQTPVSTARTFFLRNFFRLSRVCNYYYVARQLRRSIVCILFS